MLDAQLLSQMGSSGIHHPLKFLSSPSSSTASFSSLSAQGIHNAHSLPPQHQHFFNTIREECGIEQPLPPSWGVGTHPPLTMATSSCRHFLAPEVDDEDMDDEGEEDESQYELSEVEEEEEEEEDEEHQPSRLVDYLQRMSGDIRKLFSRNEGSEDYCDVYEERFETALSGRELYYADLLALANGGGSEANTTITNNAAILLPSSSTSASSSRRKALKGTKAHSCGSSEHTVVYDTTTGRSKLCTLPHEGQRRTMYGLGPLEELFQRPTPPEVGTAVFIQPGSPYKNYYFTSDRPGLLDPRHQQQQQQQRQQATAPALPPMAMRKLPTSFWEEPPGKNAPPPFLLFQHPPPPHSSSSTSSSTSSSPHSFPPGNSNPSCCSSSSMLLPLTTPDFADLFAHWTTEKC